MKNYILLLVASTSILLVSCKKDSELVKNGKVNFSFSHKVGEKELEFNKIKYINSVGHKYEVRTLKFFISNLTFYKSDGINNVYEGPIYIDAEDSSTLNFNDIDISVGSYDSIAFTFGISSDRNKTGALNTVEELSMAWPDGNQGGGYHYMKLEGTYDSLGIESLNKNYNIHTGPTMGNAYDFHVSLNNSAFTLGQNGLKAEIIMDVNEWFTSPNPYDFSEYGQMIMMNMTAQMALKANGLSVFSILID